ncbi:MAG TPA: hypothetical protein VFO65_05950 [Acidimicrobiales bacterium]|nr:hypothetical protein [Acidimicrobiales bacterium]
MAPLVAVVMVAAGLACVGLGRLGSAAVGEARARTAADAAALAGAAGGREEAARLAEANGARLTAFEAGGADVRVEVVMEDRVAAGRSGSSGRPDAGSPPARARARARWEGPAAPVAVGGLAPALRAALARAEALLGRPVAVVPAVPAVPGAGDVAAAGGRRGVPAPGAAAHAQGLAVDVRADLAGDLEAVGPGAGLCRPYPRTEPAHFELCRPPGFPGGPPG